MFLQITEDFMAAYQANYGFTQEGDSEANNTALRSTEPAGPKPENKPPEKEKSIDPTANPIPDQQETSAKEPKQKGEKRKAEPGKLASRATNTTVKRNF